VIALSITAVVLLAALLFRRPDRIPRIDPGEMARHRRQSEKEHREWIFPFEI
jgi:hypothetical protein